MAKIGQKGKKPGTSLTQGGASAGPSNALFMITEPRCKICTCPYRREIDSLLATGWTQAQTRKHFNVVMEATNPDVGSEYFSHVNFSTHTNKHLTTKDMATKKIIEARAIQEGIDLAEAEGFLLTKLAVLDLTVQNGVEAMFSGKVVVEPKDLLAALAMSDKMESEMKDSSFDTIRRSMKAFTDAVKEVVSEEQLKEISALFESKVEGDPSLQSVLPRASAPLENTMKQIEAMRDQEKERVANSPEPWMATVGQDEDIEDGEIIG